MKCMIASAYEMQKNTHYIPGVLECRKNKFVDLAKHLRWIGYLLNLVFKMNDQNELSFWQHVTNIRADYRQTGNTSSCKCRRPRIGGALIFKLWVDTPMFCSSGCCEELSFTWFKTRNPIASYELACSISPTVTPKADPYAGKLIPPSDTQNRKLLLIEITDWNISKIVSKNLQQQRKTFVFEFFSWICDEILAACRICVMYWKAAGLPEALTIWKILNLIC